MLNVLELFSGIGAQHKAITRLGIKANFTQCEIDKYAIQSYNAIHGETPNLGDISKIKEEDLRQDQWDLIFYSFPCQAISTIGLQKGFTKGSNTTSSLLWEVEKFIRKVRPKYLIMENVKNLISKKFLNDFYKWLNILYNYKYTNFIKIVNAKYFGVPQNRERTFCISIRQDLDKIYMFPKNNKLLKNSFDLLEKDNLQEYLLSKKMIKCLLSYKEEWSFKRDKIFINHINRDICATLVTSQGTRPNDNFFTEDYKVDKNILNNEDLSIDYKVDYLFDKKIRHLTPLETFRFMGFDDEDYEKVKSIGMSKTQIYKMAGNSIVVNVLQGIIERLGGGAVMNNNFINIVCKIILYIFFLICYFIFHTVFFIMFIINEILYYITMFFTFLYKLFLLIFY